MTLLFLLPRRFYSSSKRASAVAQLDQLAKLCASVNGEPSTLKKSAIVKESPACHSTLKRIYDPHLRFHLSKNAALKYLNSHTIEAASTYDDLNTLLDDLASRTLTGNAACAAVGAFYQTYCQTDEHRDIFWRILDKNLKMGVSVKTIRRVLPMESMSVALAASTAPRFDVTDQWYVSQKLDGIRCIAMIRSNKDDHDIQFYSRTGRPFQSLQKVRNDIQRRLHELKVKDEFVLDGEICAYASDDTKNEDFLKAMGQVRRSEEMENPIYQVFDRIQLDHFLQAKGDQLFSERQQALEAFVGTAPLAHVRRVAQTKLSDLSQLDHLKKESIEKGWEGLMLRKDVGYEGKRTKNLIKLKEWEDAEYTVKSIETGYMRMADTGETKRVVTNVNIEHKGYPVSVGSGFSMQSRIDYAQHPERIIGKTITVRYFAESKRENGSISLRFPTVKAVYQDGSRDM
ncbi:hypothetical protein V8B55DRAFT_1383370 [Mucor lusitanicus]|uniref:ATP-dependent DNA ligase family profile domain-containing protein n=2 Tax=Mucor circinelloides f. lusitanicus TaxID=29924 RepID=A0A168QDC8_MUCCL|nr:hypothetical protein FB192DRAFT_1366273 [Mucor lusitanicus]OAD09088.1 hypothetical protein MUCCIDRAFT_106064 [Mucor lusitanicus CBS 277.49]